MTSASWLRGKNPRCKPAADTPIAIGHHTRRHQLIVALGGVGVLSVALLLQSLASGASTAVPHVLAPAPEVVPATIAPTRHTAVAAPAIAAEREATRYGIEEGPSSAAPQPLPPPAAEDGAPPSAGDMADLGIADAYDSAIRALRDEGWAVRRLDANPISASLPEESGRLLIRAATEYERTIATVNRESAPLVKAIVREKRLRGQVEILPNPADLVGENAQTASRNIQNAQRPKGPGEIVALGGAKGGIRITRVRPDEDPRLQIYYEQLCRARLEFVAICVACLTPGFAIERRK